MIVNRGNRGRDIYQMREAGATFSSIADKWGISTERARQIYLKVKRQLDADKESVEEYGVKLTRTTLDILKRCGINGATPREEAIRKFRIRVNDENDLYIRRRKLNEVSKLLNVKIKRTNEHIFVYSK